MSSGKSRSIAAFSLQIRDLLSPSKNEYVPSAQQILAQTAEGGRSVLFHCPAARALGRCVLLSLATAAVCSGSGSWGDNVSLVIKRFCCLPTQSKLGRCSALLCVKGVGCLKEILKGTLNGLGPGVRGLKQNSSGSCWREKVV